MKARMTKTTAAAEFRAIHEALLRAAIRARELAYQTRTPLVYMKDGKLISRVPTKQDLAKLDRRAWLKANEGE